MVELEPADDVPEPRPPQGFSQRLPAIVASLRFCRPKMIANSLRTSICHKRAFISYSILTRQKGNVLEP